MNTVIHPSEIKDPSDPRYFQNYNSIYNRRPYCYAFPSSAADCKEVLAWAQAKGKMVSVRSGGHSCLGLSVLDDRVALYMTNMNKMNLNKSNNTIVVETGVKWWDLYNLLFENGLVCPGGGCPSVGVGGLVTGGGSNYFSSRWGYACDSVLEMQVLLASGEIVTANKSQHSDLFWAMLGAGHGGFGIALSFTFQLYPIPPLIYSNSLYMDFDCFEHSMAVLYRYGSSASYDNRIYLSWDCRQIYKGSESPRIAIIFVFVGPPEEGEQAFSQFVHELNLGAPSPARIDTKSIPNPSMTPLDLIKRGLGTDIVRRTVTKNRMILGSSMTADKISQLKALFTMDVVTRPQLWDSPDPNTRFSVVLYYHGGKANELPSDSNAFMHRSTDWCLMAFCYYVQAENDALFGKWKDQVQSTLSELSSDVNQNYPDEELPSWQSAYYGPNYPRLRQIKSKYDPNNYFQHLQSIE